jgi:hypothetical protein
MSSKPSSKLVSPQLAAPSVEIYFDARDGSYWYRLGGSFVALKKADLKLHLQTLGLSEVNQIKTGEGYLREIDFPFWEAMHKRLVHFAGSLAGHRTGTFKDGSGMNYLVTTEARGVFDVLPKKIPEPEFFTALLGELLPDDQCIRACYWMAQALRSLREGDFRPGQVLILAGPPKCGKSLLQAMITEILGGRSGNPFQFLIGETKFNRELAGAEHWCIEDPPSTTDLRTRRMFGNNLKNGAFTRDCSVQPKGKDTVNLPVFRRITISVNDEPENLSVCPPLEGSINDKLMLFKCSPAVKCFDSFRTGSGIDRKAVWAAFMAELPMIRAWLLKSHARVPKKWQDDRCGVAHYLHPELESELCSLSPEHRLLQLIDYVKWDNDEDLTERKAFDLENALLSKAPTQAGAIGRHLNWCGTYLGRLLKAGNPRISKRVRDGHTLWTIKPHTSTETAD